MAEKLWEPGPERIQKTNMYNFINYVNERYNQKLEDYDGLYQWSINDIEQFWVSVWNFSKIIFSQPYHTVLKNSSDMFNSKWFEGASLNFAENLLRHYNLNKPAIISINEQAEIKSLSYPELYAAVARTAAYLQQLGVKPGDRVAGYMANIPETVIAMLAATSIGAIWSSCSPDFGVNGVIDRFGQIEPKVLFTTNGYFYNGKLFDCTEKIIQITGAITSIESVVLVQYVQEIPLPQFSLSAIAFSDIQKQFSAQPIIYTQLPFDHPVYILYSSGTTGKPKCIVHGAGGTLLQHMKELILHTDLKQDDIIFYYTTCGWMMWNWLVSSLATGATIVLFDGSPFHPHPGILWELAEKTGITIFGTSAKYISSLEKTGIEPGKEYDLSRIKTILSTGSPLTKENFYYVYQKIKSDVQLSSISGGTDIISCFALGNPLGPVYAGELQCRGLGMKVESYDPEGKPLINQKGELVCTAPFPSMPLGFWNDPERQKYYQAYFNVYSNVWCHGDFIEITDRGGVIIYGRSDATLNPGGVRIGTAEIYRQVETIPEILDSLVVGQNWHDDVRVILFVKLKPGFTLNEQLVNQIKTVIRKNATPRHVPAKIIAVPDIPYTINGKKVELAVRNVIHNEPVTNREALANPEALNYFKDIPELQQE